MTSDSSSAQNKGMPLLSKENLKAERIHSVLSYTWTVLAQNDHLYLYNNIELELELEDTLYETSVLLLC